MSRITAEALTKEFKGGNKALNGLSLSFESSDFTVLAGANGCGKTILLKHLNGLVRPTEGRVLYNDVDIEKNLAAVRQKVGLVFQHSHHQIIGHTLWKDVRFGPENLRLGEEEIARRAEMALTAVNLSYKKNDEVHTLSGGELKRLALAGILAMSPEFLLLDEPLAGLDFPSASLLLEQLITLHREGHGIILITHELEKVLAHADRLIVMHQGKAVLDGRPEDVIDEAGAYGVFVPPMNRGSLAEFSWLHKG